MAVILLLPLDCYGDDDSDLRKGRHGLRELRELARSVRPVKRASVRKPLALVSSPSPTVKEQQSNNGQRYTQIRRSTE
jgi:hypothetical protein